MAVKHLDEKTIEQLRCPQGSTHLEVFDTHIKGMYVDVQANGRIAFRVRYKHADRRRVVTLGDARLITVSEARQKARDILRLVSSGQDPKADDKDKQDAIASMTLGQFLTDRYLPYVRSYKRSWASDESLIRNRIGPPLANLPLSQVSPPDLAALVTRMREQGYAVGTCNRVLVLLRYAYQLALRWKAEGLASNPVKELRNLRGENKIERYLSEAQAKQLLEAVRHSENRLLRYIVPFLIYTGARKREALDARWEDVDWDKSSWRIPRTKSSKVRHVPLSPPAVDLLRELQSKAAPADEFVFANPKTGTPFVSIFVSWDTARKRAGMPELRIHDLRHSFASFLVNAGRSLYEVQELLGHADIRTTSRYSHLSRERLRDAVSVVPRV